MNRIQVWQRNEIEIWLPSEFCLLIYLTLNYFVFISKWLNLLIFNKQKFDGYPSGSMVDFACDANGYPILAVSDLAVHSKVFPFSVLPPKFPCCWKMTNINNLKIETASCWELTSKFDVECGFLWTSLYIAIQYIVLNLACTIPLVQFEILFSMSSTNTWSC